MAYCKIKDKSKKMKMKLYLNFSDFCLLSDFLA